MLPDKVDISLDTLLERGDIHVVVYNLCMRNGLTTLGAVTRYYSKHQTFRNIPLCGPHYEKMIIVLIQEHAHRLIDVISSSPKEQLKNQALSDGPFGNVAEILNDIPPKKEPLLQQQFERAVHQLSPHAQRLLKWLLNNSGSIHQLLWLIYSHNFRFEMVAGATGKAVKELDRFRASFYDAIFSLWVLSDEKLLRQKPLPDYTSETVPGTNMDNKTFLTPKSVKSFYGPALEILEAFAPEKMKFIEEFFTRECAKLNMRASNVIQRMAHTFGSVRAMLGVIFRNDFDFKTQKNAGEKTCYELDSFRINIYDEICRLEKFGNEKVNHVHAIIPLLETFHLPGDYNYVAAQLLDADGKILLFKLIGLLVSQEAFLNEINRSVFSSIFQEEGPSQAQLARQYSRSRERIRQLSVALKEHLSIHLDFVMSLSLENIQTYDMDIFRDGRMVMVDEEMAAEINKMEGCTFNMDFYGMVLTLLLTPGHTVIPDTSGHCFIRKELAQVFDFTGWLRDVQTKKDDKINATYNVHFEGYLRSFYLPGHNNTLPNISAICEYLLFKVFDMTLQPDGHISFEKNTRKLGHEYMYEILEGAGKPMDIHEIVAAANLKYPGLNLTAKTIKPTANYRSLFFFMFNGRYGHYGLHHWEEEGANIRGGSIRTMVEEYLHTRAEPAHISEIMNHLEQYRATKKSNVMTNLKLDCSGRFVFFLGAYVGLAGRKYETGRRFQRLPGKK